MKKGGLLERLTEQAAQKNCLTCGNFIQIPNTALFACIASDKLIMPAYVPYSRGTKLSCKDWTVRDNAID